MAALGSFFFRQASEQYFTDSQFFAHDFLQVISRLQMMQSLLGRELLLPLNVDFISSLTDHPDGLRAYWHEPEFAPDPHR
jgi:hypothetical protein